MCDPVCAQIQQWEQNLEKLNLDLFRLRCYLSSLQGSELPNPKSLLAVASRPSKSMLGRLGVFSVSSFHALVSRGSTLPFFLKKERKKEINQICLSGLSQVCSREEATLRRRCRSLSGGNRRRGLPSSLKVLDDLNRRGRGGKHSAHQVLHCTLFLSSSVL